MADEIKSLVQRRTTIKAQLIRFKNYLEKCSERPDEQQIVERLQKIKDTWNVFDEVQSNLESVSLEQSMYDNNERSQFEEAYFETTARAQRLLAILRPPLAEDNRGILRNQASLQNLATKIKLPTINLPTFNGKYNAWLGFYDNFKAIVHDNIDLSSVQKLQYLRSSLMNEAAQVIQALETSSQNYEVA